MDVRTADVDGLASCRTECDSILQQYEEFQQQPSCRDSNFLKDRALRNRQSEAYVAHIMYKSQLLTPSAASKS